jgi:hypothetical protein
MGDNPQDTQAPAAPVASEADDFDSMSQVTPLRRVEAVATQMTPIHREFPEPKPAPHTGRKAMGLVLKPWTTTSKPSQMHTMSDLHDMARAPQSSDVAKVRNRHISAAQAAAARPKSDEPPKES